ncbi:uncharacterized protein LOC107609476 isoform X2 [Arachis ipaensis]|uniref:uncharacterized protein LOC107609476 isoform X2 n=1 Tax=Arachis ipaensis TaxID=130454 RepID=UPI000A2B59D5|nr:uncharacterized protein LOC107609476 isoform X2 [Arachis ipaensis]XP_025665834.1 uncharacterized protein LOC112764450 isoform X2 [Arachis hypogaea]
MSINASPLMVRNWGLLEKNENLDNSNLSGHLIFRALAYLHNSIGVCHRNIKPQNYCNLRIWCSLRGPTAKNVTLEETINKLQSENEWEKQNQASLQMRIAQLQSENSSLLEKEVGLEMRIAQLESKKSSLLQNKVVKIIHFLFVLVLGHCLFLLLFDINVSMLSFILFCIQNWCRIIPCFKIESLFGLFR